MKTNKSFTKRLKVTRRGTIMARVPGHNHFNAKESGAARMRRRRKVSLRLSHAERSRFLPN